MFVYPQLATGALCQFPLRKSRRSRTVTNRAADGSTIKLADPAAEITEWQLEYAGLSDVEAASLQGFFASVEGTLIGFTFLDPAGNLLASTDKLDGEVWQVVVPKALPEGGAWAFDHEFFVLLNLAVGGNYVGPPDPAVFPQAMIVDYVRVYAEE